MASRALHAEVGTPQFAIEFAQLDVSAANWRQVHRDVVRFAYETQPIGTVKPSAVTRAALERLQTETRDLLMHLADGQPHEMDFSLRLLVARRTDGDVLALWDGQLRDRFLYRLVQMLERQGIQKLQKCSRPDCGNLFLKVTSKAYCSTKCQSRQYMRQYRQQ